VAGVQREVERRSSGRLDLSPDWQPERGGGEVTVYRLVNGGPMGGGDQVEAIRTGVTGGVH
jgi:hypothetical protein